MGWAGIWLHLGGLSGHPEAEKRISTPRRQILGRFGKVEFSTMLDRSGRPTTPLVPSKLPCLGAVMVLIWPNFAEICGILRF